MKEKKSKFRFPQKRSYPETKFPVGIPVFERENEEKKRLEIINKC